MLSFCNCALHKGFFFSSDKYNCNYDGGGGGCKSNSDACCDHRVYSCAVRLCGWLLWLKLDLCIYFNYMNSSQVVLVNYFERSRINASTSSADDIYWYAKWDRRVLL